MTDTTQARTTSTGTPAASSSSSSSSSPSSPACRRCSSAPRRAARPEADEVVELLLVDVAVGRWMPGDEIDVSVAAAEHEVSESVVRLALHDLRRAGLVSTNPFTGGSVVVWHRRHNEVLMRRLVGVTAVVAGRRPSLEDLPEPAPASPAVAHRGLVLPPDLAQLLDLVRLVTLTLPPASRRQVLAEIVTPLSALGSTTAMRVHGVVPAISADVRGVIVDLIEVAAHYGEWDEVPVLMADYAVALGADER
ncbi:GntR family transcriptional regulator [Frigoribacterium sp. ACAM 257]|uniref:GntR family transcriptional regulator n=1 Tax=Frigoribacterium sp. ACAM 257 TaxID=2508998 RepID=UPI0011B9B7C3|nr:GntR family transcriptional regulator [Frigoribacterium sp. ACAM 257]TWX38340.1 GntR family transcriptional regulator [Frigoribacterium sp. ACAM 257]